MKLRDGIELRSQETSDALRARLRGSWYFRRSTKETEMRKCIGATVVELVVLLIMLLGAGGWIWNIVKVVHGFADPITGLFVMRCIGVFVAPVGAVLGYF